LEEFNTTVFDQISNSYKTLPEPTRPPHEPTPLPEPSIDSITTQSTPVEPPIDEEDLIRSKPPSYKNEEENSEYDYEDHESSSSTIPTVR